MKTLITLLLLTSACATTGSMRIPAGQVVVECTDATTLETKVWQGPWAALDLNACDLETHYVNYKAREKWGIAR